MTMTCPEPGRLRSWLDRDAAATDPSLESHLATCPNCQTALGAFEADAEHAARVLTVHVGLPPTAEQTEAALALVHARLGSGVDLSPGLSFELAEVSSSPVRGRGEPLSHSHAREKGLGGEGTFWRRWRLALAGAAAALTLGFALATPEGQAVAAGFLAQFRSQRLAIVTFDPNQARQTGLFRFEQLGTLKNGQPARPVEAANVQEAAGRAGFPVLQPDPATLPAGASRTPKVRFSPASETRLTFDKQKARAYFDSINRQDLALPDTLHGATLVVALPPVVMLEYAAADNKPAVMIGQAREIQVGVEGNAGLDEVRDFLLSLPNVPPDLARQLRSMQDWTNTLPIPVPVDKVTWQKTTIDSAEAYILNDNTGLGSGVIWQRDGRILGVAGPLKATDLRGIAEGLR